MTPLEILAVVMAVAYLVLAIRQNIWCWFCAGVSTAIYVWLTFVAKLYMDTALQLFYFAMAAYGWYVWTSGRHDGQEKDVVVWPVSTHAIALVLIAAVGLTNGYLLDTRTDAAFPYLDAVTTWAAVWATFLVARKVREKGCSWLAYKPCTVLI